MIKELFILAKRLKSSPYGLRTLGYTRVTMVKTIEKQSSTFSF